jgi:hypothetical protein
MTLPPPANFATVNDNTVDHYKFRHGCATPDVFLATTPVQRPGSIVYNKTNQQMYYSNGIQWLPFGSGLIIGLYDVVWSPGYVGTPPPNVFLTWPEVVNALSQGYGPRYLYFDPTGAFVVPSGCYLVCIRSI